MGLLTFGLNVTLDGCIDRTHGLLLAALVALAALAVGCAPPRDYTCEKLAQKRAPGPQSDAELKSECDRRLRAMGSGEYGACSDCIVNAVTPRGLAACRKLCRGMEAMIPDAPP